MRRVSACAAMLVLSLAMLPASMTVMIRVCEQVIDPFRFGGDAT
jgi:hypothetical protein